LAVNLFLIISGFLVARSRETSSGTWSFLKKRVLRIYPAFVVVILLEAFVVAPLATPEPFRGYTARQLGLLAYNMFDLHDYGYPYGGLYNTFADNPTPHAVNSSLWTIRYEFICYLLLAVAWPAVRWPAVFLSGLVGVWLISLPIWEPRWGSVLTAMFGAAYQWPRLLVYFWVGVSAYRFRDCLPAGGRWACVCTSLLVVGALVPPYGLRVVLPWCGAYLLLWVAYCPWLRGSRLAALPDYSYGIYLYAFPIQQLLVMWFGPERLGPWSLFTLAALGSVGCGALSWHLVEAPFLRLKNRRAAPAGHPVPDPRRG
jgi:peptidoglycan/LPS O-acetylase OafA/YrhL